ncbi:MAG: hypothetical protein L0H79_18395 [Intrasporangium sp.]|uniref:hypothetical protein n=1 Tax=Intrasporangium sp. TaxID=1925024 RepID=UPI002647066A|nr:hypothetical protein [Intrasporangium sp.]MDN5797697.1 hypothetical protein [Intrasporangium sp.]
MPGCTLGQWHEQPDKDEEDARGDQPKSLEGDGCGAHPTGREEADADDDHHGGAKQPGEQAHRTQLRDQGLTVVGQCRQAVHRMPAQEVGDAPADGEADPANHRRSVGTLQGAADVSEWANRP